MNSTVEYGYKTFAWLVFCVFCKRGFVAELDEKGLDVVVNSCPLGNDFTDDQAKRFLNVYSNTWARLVVKVWWVVYEHLVDRTDASIQSPWQP